MRVLTTYLEAFAAPPGPAVARPAGEIAIAETRLDREAYLALYHRVGEPVPSWCSHVVRRASAWRCA